ncbi:GntR family transcriptional regulator [Spiroplasma floricola]|uniref:GntR family transcriptional regulator n=1 Tax=Spiroplasma floricola 23-6 TaxID=1336749 RepID=A0A2K8SDS6_9MOLU|nr:GntR family transcriptional regulator [Spiroplasma floricola]AUB31582.1 GntR family transcriptional regulator [Spiroplasma floricola 23-6]
MDKKWEIVFDYLMYLIRENKVKPGEVLPSQNMLKTKFGYSEQPIRIAFNKLIELQIVKSVNGKGFVVQDKISNNLLFSFRELFPGSKSIYTDFEELICDALLAHESGYQINERLIKFKCFRKTEKNELILFQESYIKKEKFKNLTLKDLNQEGLMYFIEKKTSSIVSHSSKKISFITNSEDIEKYFNLTENAINGLILDEGKVYDIFGEILEFRKSYYQPKFFEWNFIEWRK